MINKLVLTGTSGRLGSYLREPLCKICNKLISTDINEDIGNGIETVCLRIVLCAPVRILRSLSSCLSYDDLI